MANDTHKAMNMPQGFIKVNSRGVEYTTARFAYPEHILWALLDHGLMQKLADSASSVFNDVWKEVKGAEAKAPNKAEREAFYATHGEAIQAATLAAMQKADDALRRGDWQIRVTNGTSTRNTPQENLALSMAQDALALRFGNAANAKGLHQGDAAKCPAHVMASLGEAVASFFNTDQKRVTWNKPRLCEYIAKQRDEGQVDYMALAAEELARQAELAQELADNIAEVEDFSDL